MYGGEMSSRKASMGIRAPGPVPGPDSRPRQSLLCPNFFAVLLASAPASHAVRSNTLDAKDLRVFEVVARCEGMKRAAAELNTVQSNVTTRIRNLEQDLGVSLFERRPNGLKLPPAGTRLLPYAYEVRAAISNARRAVEDVGKPTGPL